MENKEKVLIKKIRDGDEQAFENLFFEYYTSLCEYSTKIVQSQDLAADAVQEVFIKIWETRNKWDVYHSLKVYLYQAVRNQSLNLLERKNRQNRLSEQISNDGLNLGQKEEVQQEKQQLRPDYVSDLVKNIWNVVETMPKRRRTAFILSRQNGLTHQEIAGVMDIERKTVENHIILALKTIREDLDSNTLKRYHHSITV